MSRSTFPASSCANPPRNWRREFPTLPVVPIEADFLKPIALPGVRGSADARLLPGSTIGNLAPGAAVDCLRSMRETLGRRALLIGFDRVKDLETLIAAYDDARA